MLRPAALLLLALFLATSAKAATLRSFGARGDGSADDRTAIQEALVKSAGAELDGEGLTYAIDGNIEAAVPIRLRNCTLRQIARTFDTAPFIRSTRNPEPPSVAPADALREMKSGVPLLRFDGVATYPEDPEVSGADRVALLRMLNLRTLFVKGSPAQPLAVSLENVKILMGEHADAGMHSNAAGLYLVGCAPLALTDVEVTGRGKGAGIFVHDCKDVRFRGVNVHDIVWAPYQGDVDFSTAVLRDDFGWNNSPIYDFQPRTNRFVRVRVQEQLAGIVIAGTENVELSGCRVHRIGTMVEGQFLPWQADGMTISGVKNFTMRDSTVSETWEGIDFTGRGVDGFLQQNITIRDAFSYGFKYAHPQRNGRVIDCVSEQSSFKGFIVGAECENIEFIHCTARDTGARRYWHRGPRPSIDGFSLQFEPNHSPRNITFRDCTATDSASPPNMNFGFQTSDQARKPELGIHLINPQVKGAALREIDGFQAE